MAKKKIITSEMSKETIGMTRDFVIEYLAKEGFKKWSLVQNKILMFYLSEIDYTRGQNKCTIFKTYEELAKGLGWEYQKTGDTRNLRNRLAGEIKYMAKTSAMFGEQLPTPSSKEKGEFGAQLITSYRFDKLGLNINFNKEFFYFLEDFFSGKKAIQFFTVPTSDFKLFKTKNAYFFFCKFMTLGMVGGSVNDQELSTREIKALLGMDKDAYVRSNGKFDRDGFEKRVIIPAMQDIDKTEMLEIIKTDDGAYFEKVYVRRKVKGYRFRYKIYNIYQIYEKRKGHDVQPEIKEVVYTIPALDED